MAGQKGVQIAPFHELIHNAQIAESIAVVANVFNDAGMPELSVDVRLLHDHVHSEGFFRWHFHGNLAHSIRGEPILCQVNARIWA